MQYEDARDQIRIQLIRTGEEWKIECQGDCEDTRPTGRAKHRQRNVIKK